MLWQAKMTKMDGPGIAAVGVGVVFLYGGIKGYSPIKAFENIITGKNPNENQNSASLVNATSDNSGSGSSSNGGVAPASSSESDWIKAFLTAIGAPQTTANINSLAAWMRHEFGSWPPSAKNNPFATTEPMPGSTQFNSVGVQNYASAADGVSANATTITNGRYSSIVNALKAGTGICGGNYASEFSTWSGGGYTSVC
jgi:hypothetical protein